MLIRLGSFTNVPKLQERAQLLAQFSDQIECVTLPWHEDTLNSHSLHRCHVLLSSFHAELTANTPLPISLEQCHYSGHAVFTFQYLSLEMLSQLHYQRVGALIHEDAEDLEYFRAIRCANAGELYLQPTYTRSLISKFIAATPRGDLSEFSSTELQIAEFLRRGFDNKRIAFEMNISVSTVKRNIHSLCRKLGVKNRLEIVSALYYEN